VGETNGSGPATQSTLEANGAARHGRGDGHAVLLVEDEPALVALVSRLLEREGYRVHAATSAEQAIDIVRRPTPIDLLLTDVVLPGRNGRELSEAINALYPGTPTIFMSGYGDDVIERTGIDPSRARLLDKPFRPEELYASVRDAIAAATGPVAGG